MDPRDRIGRMQLLELNDGEEPDISALGPLDPVAREFARQKSSTAMGIPANDPSAYSSAVRKDPTLYMPPMHVTGRAPQPEMMAGDPVPAGGSGGIGGMLTQTILAAMKKPDASEQLHQQSLAMQAAHAPPMEPPPLATSIPVREPEQPGSAPAPALPPEQMDPAPPKAPGILSAFGPEQKAALRQSLAQKYDPELAGAQMQSTIGHAGAALDRGFDAATQALVTRGGTRATALQPSGNPRADAEADAPLQQLAQRRASATQQGAQDRALAKRDPTSEESRLMQALVRQALPGMKLDGLDGMSAEFLEPRFGDLIHAETANSKDSPEARALAARKITTAEENAAAKKESLGYRERSVNATEENAETRRKNFEAGQAMKKVDGVEFDDPAAHTPAEAVKLRAYNTNLARLDDALGGLEGEFRKNGAQFLPTEAKRLMDYYRARAIPLINAMEGMAPGMPTGHQHLLEDQLAQQATAGNVVNPEAYLRLIQQIREDAHKGHGYIVKSMGGRAVPSAAESHAAHPSGSVKMINMKTGQTVLMDASDAAEAPPEEWRRADG